MMQGDMYSLAIQVRNNAGMPVTPEDITDMEIAIGELTKSYRKQELAYHDGFWLFPLSQQETFMMPAYSLKGQVRVYWKNGAIEGQELHGIRVRESISKEVL